jgi:hypothetical protein
MAIQKISNAVINTGAVTSDSIATGAVNAVDILDGTITANKLNSTLDLSSNTLTLPTLNSTVNIDVADLFVKDTTGGAQGQVQIGAGTVQGFINIQKGDGTRTVQISSDGDTYFNGGNVGIGTASPNNYNNWSTLTLNNLSGGEIDFEVNGTLYADLFANSGDMFMRHHNGNIRFYAGGSATENERVRITSGGNVGIGTTSPSEKLVVDVGAPSASDKVLGMFRSETSREIGFVWDDSQSTLGIATLTNHSMVFHTNGNSNERMRITPAGRVGVGVNNPLYPVTVGHSNPNNGIVQQLRNTTSNGNGAFLHFDINNVGDYSIGMPNNDNSLVIGKDLGNTGDQLVKYNADGSVLNNYGGYPSRELTFNWAKSVSTSYVDLVTLNVPNAHYGYFYEIITTGGDWSNHSSARSYHKGMVNGYNGYGGHTKIESSGPYGSNIAINCVFVNGNGETKLQIKLDSGTVTLEVYVRLIGRVSNHTIHR